MITGQDFVGYPYGVVVDEASFDGSALVIVVALGGAVYAWESADATPAAHLKCRLWTAAKMLLGPAIRWA